MKPQERKKGGRTADIVGAVAVIMAAALLVLGLLFIFVGGALLLDNDATGVSLSDAGQTEVLLVAAP